MTSCFRKGLHDLSRLTLCRYFICVWPWWEPPGGHSLQYPSHPSSSIIIFITITHGNSSIPARDTVAVVCMLWWGWEFTDVGTVWQVAFLTHLPLVIYASVDWVIIGSVMACRLFGAKPLTEPMLVYCQLVSWEQISVKFEFEFYHFHTRKCIWKCRLPKWRPFCPEGDELMCTCI